MIGLYNNHMLVSQRDEDWITARDVVPRQSELVEILLHGCLEIGIDWQATQAMNRNENGSPAPSPPEASRGTLHLGMTFGSRSIIFECYSPLLSPKSGRATLAHVCDPFRLRTSLRLQPASHAGDMRIIGHDMGQLIGADITGCTVAE